MTHHLAQINIARAVAPLESPVMAEFMTALDAINALAERSPGFVWRLKDEAGNATAIRPYADDRLIINLTVWENIEMLKAYAYKTTHVDFVRRRHLWFETLDLPYLALWWIPTGQIPTVWEAKDRLEHLRTHGESPYAFSFRTTFAPDVSVPAML
jgi:hypothetical protein